MTGATLCRSEVVQTLQEQRVDPAKLWRRYAKSRPGSKIEDQLVQQYLPLVRTVVGRLAMTLPAHAATEDLYSAGLVGLLHAVRRYNHKAGVLFETYARVRIRGAVFDELRKLDWVPRSVHDKARKVAEVMRKLEQKKGKAPTNAEMAKELDITEDEYEEGEATQHEAVADATVPDPGHNTERRELSRIIAKRLEVLPDMQRKVLALYYFEDLRLREIAEVFGVTESRISQIHAAAILSIKGFLAKHDTIQT
jgi:RNA polymerase sigma factor for flagellar operon FliA